VVRLGRAKRGVFKPKVSTTSELIPDRDPDNQAEPGESPDSGNSCSRAGDLV
jgi:hypothetical protein